MSLAHVTVGQANSRYRLNVTHAYLLALALIAFSMLSSYWILTNRVKTNIDKASIINTAGMQRMLSQRLGLLARELVASDNSDLTADLVSKFETALNRFDSNHASLTTLLDADYTTQSIKNLYSGNDGVDARSRQFIELAREILSEIPDASKTPTLDLQRHVSQLVTIARNGFLDELDAVVQQYENEATTAVKDFVRLEMVILCIGLLLLLFEALFIFRPIVRISQTRQEKLEKTNNELMEFSFRISHDLRSPVASCRGMVEIAQEAMDDNDAGLASDVIERMDMALLRLETLIEDIIKVTRNNVSETTAESVDLHAMITDTLDELSAMPGFEDFYFDVDTTIRKTLYAKKLYLQQIIQNLLSNAIKYANTSAEPDAINVPPRVTISSRKIGGQHELIVEDNGTGIPENCHSKVFGMFNRFHPTMSQGSGLGLYLAKQNAMALGGDLYYEPLDHGSRFRLKFRTENETQR